MMRIEFEDSFQTGKISAYRLFKPGVGIGTKAECLGRSTANRSVQAGISNPHTDTRFVYSSIFNIPLEKIDSDILPKYFYSVLTYSYGDGTFCIRKNSI